MNCKKANPVDWAPPRDWQVIKTIDAHTGGEPLRVIVDGLPPIPGKSMLEKRRYARRNLDHLRTGLMWEPRGHADMYGAVLTDPVTSDGDFGVLFLHNEGFSTMCGHGIIALTKAVLDCGIIRKNGSDPTLRIDTPAGRVTSTAHRRSGSVEKVSFINVPSFVSLSEQSIPVPGIGPVSFDIAFGGAFYAFSDASQLGLKIIPEEHDEIVRLGRLIKKSVMDQFSIRHPFEPDLGFLYGTIFTGPARDPANHSRNVCVFAEGEVDRSPTGTGVSARAAIHFSRGELDIGESIRIESILGTCMEVKIIEKTVYGDRDAVLPEVSGEAHLTGRGEFWFDPSDPLRNGFILR